MPKARRTIPPTKYLHECFIYNPETGALGWKQRPLPHFVTTRAWKKWNTRYAGKAAGVINKNGYWLIRINDEGYLSHRVIWKMITGKEPPLILDHKDGNPANNCLSNLRAATPLQQQWNKRLPKTNTSGFRGVVRNRSKWQAQIKINGVCHYRGIFDTPEEASAVYETAARELHGEFYRQG